MDPEDHKKALGLLRDYIKHIDDADPDKATALLKENYDFFMEAKLADWAESVGQWLERDMRRLVEKVKSKKKIDKLLDEASRYVEAFAAKHPEQSGSYRAQAHMRAARGRFLRQTGRNPPSDLWEEAADLSMKAAGIHHRLRRRGVHKTHAVEYLCEGSAQPGADRKNLIGRAVSTWKEARTLGEEERRVKAKDLAKAAAAAIRSMSAAKRKEDAREATDLVLQALRVEAESEEDESRAGDIWAAHTLTLSTARDFTVPTQAKFQVETVKIKDTPLQADVPIGSNWRHTQRLEGQVVYRFTRTGWYDKKTLIDLSAYEDGKKYKIGKASVKGEDLNAIAKGLWNKYKKDYGLKGKSLQRIKDAMGAEVEKSSGFWWRTKMGNGDDFAGRLWVFHFAETPGTWVLTISRRAKFAGAPREASLDALIASIRPAK